MRCTCGNVYRLINKRVLVDEVEKEYRCPSCASKFLLYKDEKGNYRMDIDGKQTNIKTTDSTEGSFWGDSKKRYVSGTGYDLLMEV